MLWQATCKESTKTVCARVERSFIAVAARRFAASPCSSSSCISCRPHRSQAFRPTICCDVSQLMHVDTLIHFTYWMVCRDRRSLQTLTASYSASEKHFSYRSSSELICHSVCLTWSKHGVYIQWVWSVSFLYIYIYIMHVSGDSSKTNCNQQKLWDLLK